MKAWLPSAIGFLTFFTISNLLMAFYWAATMPGTVYYCHDSLEGLDYLLPGSWVHGDWVHADDVEATAREELADTLLTGWTIGKLWLRWSLMFGGTVIVSTVLTYLLRSGVATDPEG